MISRDLGISVPLPSGNSLWIFGDTGVYEGAPGQMVMTQFTSGSSAAEGRYASGVVPASLMEVPSPGRPLHLSSQNPPAQFLPPPTNLYLPDGSGRPCGFAPGQYPTRWATGAALMPGASQVLVTYADVCVTGPWQFVGEGWGFATYDWQTNGFAAGPFDTFAPRPSGTALPPEAGFGSPVVVGGNVTLFSSVCTELYGVCTAGRVNTTTFPATLAALRNPASYAAVPAVTDGSARWAPVGISVGSYADTPYRMVESTAVDGSYTVLTASTPAGPWHLQVAGKVPGCQTASSAFCYSLVGHPELSDSAALMLSYYDPNAGPYSAAGPVGHVLATPVGLRPIARIYGSDAIATSIEISRAQFPPAGTAGAVVLARSDFFSDALAGGPLAAAVGAPLLITPGTTLSSGLDPRVSAEIQRTLRPGGTVYVLGGTLALSGSIDAELRRLGYTATRVSGWDDHGTAIAIAEQLGYPQTVFEATATSFYDALSAVPAAVKAHGAILLTDGRTQAPPTAAYLNEYEPATRYAIGGPYAAYGADPTAIPVYGDDLWGTSAQVAARFFPGATVFGAATGAYYADALSGGVFMGALPSPGPVLLVAPSGPLPAPIAGYLSANAGLLARGFLFGGPLAVGDDVLSELALAH